MLTFSRVTVVFDATTVLHDVTFALPAGSRTALVGVNGSGKSTLLAVAAGLLRPTRGSVSRSPDARVVLAPQEPADAGHADVAGYLRERAGLGHLHRRLRRLEERLQRSDGDATRVAAAYGAALEAYGQGGGWAFEAAAGRTLERVGVPGGWMDRPLEQLSGGERARVGLAGLLISPCSVQLLDEPTNNLDAGGLELLAAHLQTTDATVLLVSHDRALLRAVADHVVELDEHDHTATVYRTGYDTYVEQREHDRSTRRAHAATTARERARLVAAQRAHEATAARTTDARPRRDNDKFAGHLLTARAARQAAGARRRLQRRVDRLEPVDAPREGWSLRLALDVADRSGQEVVRLDAATCTVGGFRLGPVTLAVDHAERVGLLGPNGAGKTLLLSLLTGERAPESGRVRRGPAVSPGVLRQSGADLATPDTGLEVFRAALGWPETRSRTLLAKFDLTADHIRRPTRSYSPGERCRLGLAILMARRANLLVLDEPTNHLDLEALEQLESALASFDGTLMVVTHDRAFRDALGLTRLVSLEGGRVTGDTPA